MDAPGFATIFTVRRGCRSGDALGMEDMMSRLWKVPSAIAEYTVGTVIVLMHVGVIRPLEDRALRRRNELGINELIPANKTIN